MKDEKLIHDWMISHLKERLSKDYNEIRVNLDKEKNEHKGHLPDLILGNQGHVLALIEVETNNTITSEKAAEWKTLSDLGAKLIVMVPKPSKAKAVDLLWKNGLAGKVSVGSYEISVSMP